MFERRFGADYLQYGALDGQGYKRTMSLGAALSNVRWTERKAGLEAWASAASTMAKRRIAARWMPIAAALVIFATLVLLGALGITAGIVAVMALVTAAAVWPLDTTAVIDVLTGKPLMAAGSRAGEAERNSWRAVIDAIPTAALALDGEAEVEQFLGRERGLQQHRHIAEFRLVELAPGGGTPDRGDTRQRDGVMAA